MCSASGTEAQVIRSAGGCPECAGSSHQRVDLRIEGPYGAVRSEVVDHTDKTTGTRGARPVIPREGKANSGTTVSKFIAPEEFGGPKQDDGSVRREASRARECFSEPAGHAEGPGHAEP